MVGHFSSSALTGEENVVYSVAANVFLCTFTSKGFRKTTVPTADEASGKSKLGSRGDR